MTKTLNPITVSRALELGYCEHCVSYCPLPLMPPFSTVCHSTRARVRWSGEGECLCTKDPTRTLTRQSSPDGNRKNEGR